MANSQLTIKEYMSAPAVQKKMQEMLLDRDSIRNFSTSVMAISQSDKLLAEAEPRSLFNAALEAASMNLPINKNLGFAHIIGYRNNKKLVKNPDGSLAKDADGRTIAVVEAQFQMGARGFKELAQRSGRYKIIHEGDVRQGEVKSRNRLTGEVEWNWIDDDAAREALPIIGYFSYFRLDNGFESTWYWTVDEVKEHANKYSQAYKKGYGPWVELFDAMAKKTVMKLNISKNGPLDINLQKALTIDQAVIGDDNKVEYIDGELADVGADDNQKQAIIDANTEDGAAGVTDDLDDLEAQGGSAAASTKDDDAVSKTFPGAKDVTPKKSVKEKAADFVAKGKAANAAKKAEAEKGQQASLVDEGDDNAS